MTDSLYVRIRGRVHGPMPIEKLRQLAAKGQLSRVHEISDDGQSWRAAATQPELFARPSATAATNVGSTSPTPATNSRATNPRATQVETGGGSTRGLSGGILATQVEMPRDSFAASPMVGWGGSPSAEEAWYYASDGQQQGPTSQSNLLQMIAAGRLAPDDMVWKEGMGQWMEIQRVTALATVVDGSRDSGTSGGQEMSAGDAASVVYQLTSCVAWIRVTMVCSFILAILLALGSVGQVVMALSLSKTTVLLAAAVPLVYAALFLWLGVMLNRANGQIRVAQSHPTLRDATLAVGEMRPAWLALGVLSMWTLFLIFTTLVIFVVMLSVGGDMLDGLQSGAGN